MPIQPLYTTLSANAPLLNYDKYIVCFSGGKDSIASFLYLVEIGVPPGKIELWHHLIDGDGETFMDWECTTDYCRKFAQAFGVPIYFSWKVGGFKREMLRENSLTAPTAFEDIDHRVHQVGGNLGKPSTRRKFPQVTADLSVRWCSAYLKIDVCATAIRHQTRFHGIRTLIITGERGEESAQRGKYEKMEPDRSDLRDGERVKRHVDHARPIRDWKEQSVWNIIERHRVRMHPAYYLGWSRLSCKICIFGNDDQFASAHHISPKLVDQVSAYEKEFGVTIKRKKSVEQLVASGSVYATAKNKALIKAATTEEYTLPIFIDPWVLPAGAYTHGCGPT